MSSSVAAAAAPASAPQFATPVRPSRPSSASASSANRSSSAHRRLRKSNSHAAAKMDQESWNRLVQPNEAGPFPSSAAAAALSGEISSVFDDCKNCSFHPEISERSSALVTVPFAVRAAQDIKRFTETRLSYKNFTSPAFSGDSRNFTFQPHINHHSRLDVAVENRGSFLTRYRDDLKHRAERQIQLNQMELYSFTPELQSTSIKKAAKIKTPFLQRLSDDIEKREIHAREHRQAEASVPFTFQPVVHISRSARSASSAPSFKNFLGRMLNDVDDRQEFFTQRNRELAKPYVPDDASSSSYSARKQNSARSRPQSARR